MESHFPPDELARIYAAEKSTILTENQPKISCSYLLLQAPSILWDSLMSSKKDWDNLVPLMTTHSCVLIE